MRPSSFAVLAPLPRRVGRFFVLLTLALIVGLLASSPAQAATYRYHIARVPSYPTSMDTARIWMNSDTAFGETAAIEYRINGDYTKVYGTFDTSYPGANWRADIPAQPNGTVVEYQLFTRNEHGTDYGHTGFLWSYTVGAAGPTISGARAMWLDRETIAWNGTPGASYRLLFDPNGEMDFVNAEATACPATPAAPCHLALTAGGTIAAGAFPKNPNANGLTRLTLNPTADQAKALLKGQLVVASYNGATVAQASGVQLQGVLDHLYVDIGTADDAALGLAYSGGTPTVRLWAPTAQSVTLKRYADAATTTATDHAMTLDPASGVWSVTGDATWDRQYYLFDVAVYVPSEDEVVHNLVTDPYAVNLSADGAAAGDVRSQFVNLADPTLMPSGWTTLVKPTLAAPEDIVVYEVHVRDFSINDVTVPEAKRGTFAAFTETGSDGMSHLLRLQQAGLTHVHLLPAFDIASVIETTVPRDVSPAPTGFPRNSDQQQAAVGAARANDGFNWGYDPYHYGAPEGSYSTNAADTSRILEFRQMVQALNTNGLRVVMDIVYNHTAASGQSDKSVLDKVVPGYYHRYDATGALYESSCCADTASEYAMMEKLMVETMERWARDYKVDGFRFDLMNLHTVQNAVSATAAVKAIDPTIYVYGEGWDFGSAAAKGLTTCPNCYAKQSNMWGTGIGTFNDRLRDAAHGGYSTDSTGIRTQGFINGLSYDWNGYCYADRYTVHLHQKQSTLRSALAGSLNDYTADPQESVPYVSKHDNETLFDQNVFKMPSGGGAGLPGWCGGAQPFTPMADRVRAQQVGLSLVGLSQGIPFFHMGSDILRSKSLDRNSYDSGDWFNRVDWTYGDGTYSNNFGVGLPPAWDNASRWPIMGPLLANTALDPTAADAQFAAAQFRETLRIRTSSPLFRLRTASEVNSRVAFPDASNSHDGLVVMTIGDGAAYGADLDPQWDYIVVLFNANKIAQTYTIGALAGNATVALHPVLADNTDADPVVKTASFNSATGAFTVPPRTTAVFVATQAPTAPSTIDWVGKMFPRGGVSHAIPQGGFTPAGFDIFVRVYEAGVTPTPGAPTGISCALHWGKYGETWTDIPMTFNAQYGNDDEFKATILRDDLNALLPGTYGFTAYCKKDGEAGVRWKQDSYNIDGNPLNDDQGDGIITIIPTADSSAEPDGGVFVHLFEWRWTDIAQECPYLGEKGYTAVQVSPPQEHIVPTAAMGGNAANAYPWWVRYQPVTHDLDTFTSRSGTWAEFQSMVTACANAGVAIYVDAVINHMADIEVGTPPTGTAGTEYEADAPGRFYGAQYTDADFYGDCVIGDYGDRRQVQRCQLSGLPDLNTGRAETRAKLTAYLQALVNAGVKGFRIDGAKHMAAHEIEAILDGVEGDFYVFQEVIDQSASERVRDWEYAPGGDVTEFAYVFALGYAFDDSCAGTLSGLQNVTNAGDMMPSRFAQVFTDNHDNQRGHGVGAGCVVDHRDGQEHVLANVFLLAYPYGHPSVMSSYYWNSNPTNNNNDSYGPPTINGGPGTGGPTLPVYDGGTPVNCSPTYEWGKWACEHRRTSTANMVEFRRVTAQQGVTGWTNVNDNHIAFGRGAKGYVAINQSTTAAPFTYQTAMAPGRYCDITKYDTGISGNMRTCLLPGTTTPAPGSAEIVVSANGQIVGYALGVNDAFAIHEASRLDVALAVTLDSFSAREIEGGIELAWATVSEQNMLGFNLLRGATSAAPTETLNPALIPATGGSQGASYSFLDEAPLPGAFYWLDAIETDGSTERFGPITIEIPTAVTVGAVGAAAAPSPWHALLPLGLLLAALASRRR